MERHLDWEKRLIARLARSERRPFEWGRHDCVQFAARCVKATTGHRPPLLRGLTYRSGAGAVRALDTLGFADVREAADAALGDRFGPLMAAAGWIVLAQGVGPGGTALALGVMWRGHALFAGAEGAREGLVRVEPHALLAAWPDTGTG